MTIAKKKYATKEYLHIFLKAIVSKIVMEASKYLFNEYFLSNKSDMSTII